MILFVATQKTSRLLRILDSTEQANVNTVSPKYLVQKILGLQAKDFNWTSLTPKPASESRLPILSGLQVYKWLSLSPGCHLLLLGDLQSSKGTTNTNSPSVLSTRWISWRVPKGLVTCSKQWFEITISTDSSRIVLVSLKILTGIFSFLFLSNIILWQCSLISIAYFSFAGNWCKMVPSPHPKSSNIFCSLQ